MDITVRSVLSRLLAAGVSLLGSTLLLVSGSGAGCLGAECVAGATRVCQCDGPVSGTQACGDDGAWEPCSCAGADGDADGDANADGDADADGDAAPTIRRTPALAPSR